MHALATIFTSIGLFFSGMFGHSFGATSVFQTFQGGTGSSNLGSLQLLATNSLGNVISTSTPTAAVFNATSTTATSTFANGISLTGGCFKVGGSCVSGGGGTPGGSNMQVQFNDSGSFGGNPSFIWDKNTDQLAIGDGSSTTTVEGYSGLFNATGDSVNLTFNASNAKSATFQGGSLSMNGGFGSTSGSGGDIDFNSGSGSQNSFNGTGNGGHIAFVAGSGGATSGAGGSISLTAGSAQGGNSNGGSVTLNAGAKSGAGTNGDIALAGANGKEIGVSGAQGLPYVYTGTQLALFDASLLSSTDKTFTFPNTTGTFAVGSSTTPTLGTCGTASISATSTITRGTINVTAGTPTTCNIFWPSALADTPTCTVSTNSVSLLADIDAASTTGVQFGMSASFSGRIHYICLL